MPFSSGPVCVLLLAVGLSITVLLRGGISLQNKLLAHENQIRSHIAHTSLIDEKSNESSPRP